MSDTPRTDAEAFDITTGKPDIDGVVMADFARELERENAALREDRERLDWLERFLQLGGASVFSSATCKAHKDRPDDTEETRWNHPFHIGYDVELEHRGCYKWRELANGAKGIRPAIDAARAAQGKEAQP